jgi:hypothetical protein
MMASSAAVPGAELSSAAALAECCEGLLRPGGDAEAVRSALDALCAAGGDAMRRHADGLAPLVVGRLGDGDAAVREAARRFLLLLMEVIDFDDDVIHSSFCRAHACIEMISYPVKSPSTFTSILIIRLIICFIIKTKVIKNLLTYGYG